MTISNSTRDRIKKISEPVALAFGRLGLTPDGLTLIGFAITVIGALLLAFGLWLPGGIVIFVGGVFDMFDGTLARATNRVSNLGAFMDSVFDRWGEALVYVGLIGGLSLGGWGIMATLAGAAMASAFLVSYARAKSEGLGFETGRGMAAVGIMPREVRLVILCLGLIVGGALPTTGPVGETPTGIAVIGVALGIIALGATITVIQRVLHTRGQAGSDVSRTMP